MEASLTDLHGPIPAGVAPAPDERTHALAEAAIAHEEGDLVALSAVFARYPTHREELERMLGLEIRHGIAPPRPDPLASLEAGPSVAERYEILGILGEGTYGLVLKARDRELGRLVALKVFKKGLDELSALVRFLDEPQVASQLDHPGIPAVFARGKMPDGKPYVAMRLVTGQTLKQKLESGASLTELLDVFRQVCQVVSYAHSRGVVHRDLKPANVMVGRFGEVQVLDWGLNRVLLAGEEPPRTWRQKAGPALPVLTQEGAWVGTPSYMPPEQANTTGQADTPSDVFGLGAILCEILTGKPPYAAEDGAAIWQAIERADLQKARQRLKACPADRALTALAQTCMAASPASRPTAGAVAATVEKYLADLQERLAKKQAEASRARAWAAAIALASILVVGATAAALLYYASEAARFAREAAASEARRSKVADLLSRAEKALRTGDFPSVAPELASARGRLAEGGENGQKDQADRLARCLAFVRECEKARQWQGSDGAGYAGTLERLGLPLPSQDREAAFITEAKASPVRKQIVEALDRWGLMDNAPGERKRLLRLARALAGGAGDSAWGQRFRSEEVRRDPRALRQLAEETSPEACSPVELETLAWAVAKGGHSPASLLRRGLVRYPGEARLHLALARSLPQKTDLPEALEHARVALALRPVSLETREVLATLLAKAGRPAEAASELRQIVIRKPSSDVYRKLVDALIAAADLGGAENACREWISAFGNEPGATARLETIRRRRKQ